MRSGSVIVCLVLASFVAVSAHAACPVTAPGVLRMVPSPFHCSESTACPQGEITFMLQGLVPPGPLPVPGTYSFYRIQPCDVVEWSFGDGEKTTLTGFDRVRHVYAAPGNYAIQAKVSNPLGSITVAYEGGKPVVIATSPSQLSFGTRTNRFTLPGGLDTECSDCVLVREDVERPRFRAAESRPSRTVSAKAMVYSATRGSLPVTFLPGERRRT